MGRVEEQWHEGVDDGTKGEIGAQRVRAAEFDLAAASSDETDYPGDRENSTVTWVSTSTGVPFSTQGWYFHCLTASMAAGASRG